MKNRHTYLILLVLILLSLAACGEPHGTRPPGITAIPVVDVNQPIYKDSCTPTPTDGERAAVVALGLSDKIEFELQRAIYLAQEQGIPRRPASITFKYDPHVITVTQAIALAEDLGIRVMYPVLESYHYIAGVAPLEAVPQLAAEPGVVGIWLDSLIYLEKPPCQPA